MVWFQCFNSRFMRYRDLVSCVCLHSIEIDTLVSVVVVFPFLLSSENQEYESRSIRTSVAAHPLNVLVFLLFVVMVYFLCLASLPASSYLLYHCGKIDPTRQRVEIEITLLVLVFTIFFSSSLDGFILFCSSTYVVRCLIVPFFHNRTKRPTHR